MSFSHEYNFPLFVTTGSVLSSGHSSTLAPAQLAVFVDKTHNVLSGHAGKFDALRIIQGSLHKKDKIGLYYGGMKKSDESPAFLTSGILSFERSLPRAAQAEEWVIGWDGVDSTKNLAVNCDTWYRFKVKVWGEDVYGTFLRPIEREIGFKTECCADGDCASGCTDATVAPKTYAKVFADLIRTDPELKYFVDAEAIFSDAVTNAATHRLYCMSVCDDGSQHALAAVQVAEGISFPVTRLTREGTISTYQTVTVLDGPDGSPVATPADFTALGSIALAACNGACPSGYTLVPSLDVYVVERPLAGTEDLSTSGARQTFATTIGTAYGVHTFNGATAVDPTTDLITVVAHGFVTGTPVVYSNGGGTSITGLTTATTYYVIKSDADNFKLATTRANALAGTAINITADGVGAAHTVTVVITSTFLSQNGATATIQMKVPHGITIAALLSDSVAFERTIEALCTPPAGSAIAWTACGDRYKTSRTLRLTLEKVCGSANRLTEVVAFYANVPNISVAPTLATAGTCNDIYEIQQYDDSLLVDGCLTEGVPTYTELPTFEGFSWVVVPAAAPSTSVKAGVRIRTAYEDTKFGGCSFSPVDYYSVRPLSVEITQLDDSGQPCVAQFPSRRIKYASMPTQSGEWAIREFIKQSVYRVNGEYHNDPRLREVMDNLAQEAIDRNKNYVVYYWKVQAHRPTINHVADFSPEIYEFQILAPMGTSLTTLENTLGAVAAQNGVALRDR